MKEIALTDFRGRRVLLVFSDPACKPCDELAPKLEELHRKRSKDLAVVMVSRGDEDANRAKAAQHGLTFPVLRQTGWGISKKYAKFGTPVGYAIDEDGVIAADHATGVESILSLARAPRRSRVWSRTR